MNKQAMGILSGLSAAAIWGGMYVVSKVVMNVVPPFALITSRLALGILTLWIVVLLRGGIHISRRQFWQVFAVGIVGYGVSLGFQFVGTNLSTAANGSLVTSATPAFILLFASIILRERVTTRRILALVVSTIGVVAVIDPRTARLDPGLFLGNLALLAAALTWALYSVLIRAVTRELDVLAVSLVAFLGGFPVSIPATLWEAGGAGIGTITPWVLAGILFIGIIATALAMALWNNSFALLDANVASLTFFAQPIVGALLGWMFLHEAITPVFLVGGALVALGLLIASRETGS